MKYLTSEENFNFRPQDKQKIVPVIEDELCIDS